MPASRRWRCQSLVSVGLLSILFLSPLAAQSEFGEKRDFLRASSSTLEARWEQLSALQKSAAYLKRITPFYSWINLCTALDVDEKSLLMGDCLDDERIFLFRLPPEQFRREHSDSIERLWATSELDAMTYANASLGQDTSDITLKNSMSVAQLIAIVVVGFVFLKRFRFPLFGRMPAIGRTKMKRVFYVSVAIWLLGGAALQILGRMSGYSIALLNLQTLVLVIFGSLSLVLGSILFGQWLWLRGEQH